MLLSAFDWSRDFYCIFVHLKQYPGKYTARFFGFGVCSYCNRSQQGGLWATLSDACLEALEETVPSSLAVLNALHMKSPDLRVLMCSRICVLVGGSFHALLTLQAVDLHVQIGGYCSCDWWSGCCEKRKKKEHFLLCLWHGCPEWLKCEGIGLSLPADIFALPEPCLQGLPAFSI